MSEPGKAVFKLAESPSFETSAMNTIRCCSADDAHAIYGTAFDESLGDPLRVTVIATGLISARENIVQPPLAVVQPQAHLRTGTDKLPIQKTRWRSRK